MAIQKQRQKNTTCDQTKNKDAAINKKKYKPEKVQEAMQRPEYFEGTLQLRNPTEELLEGAMREISKKGDVSVATVKKVPNGYDIYVSSQRFLRTLGQKLQVQFGGHLVYSKKLFTQHRLRSTQIYRVNVLLRLPEFKKGDIVRYKGSEVQVVGMKKKALVKDLKTGEKYSVNFDELTPRAFAPSGNPL